MGIRTGRLVAWVLLASSWTAFAAEFEAYHGKSGNYHQERWNALRPLGYRPVSLSIYGPASSPLYAAVWIKRSGPQVVGFHGKTAAEYQALVTDNWSLGYRPTIVTATGSGSSTVFAGLLERNYAALVAKHGLLHGESASDTTIEYWLDWAFKNGYRVRWATLYGTAATPVYAIVLEPGSAAVAWGSVISGTPGDYQKHFDAMTAQWARPSFVTLSNAQRYFGVFRDDSIGAWSAFHDNTADQYQALFNQKVYNEGYYPLVVQGGGSGSGVRYAGVFVKGETVVARTFTKSGTAVSSLSAFDKAMEDYMKAKGIRAGSIAVSRNGQLVLARGYTWSEPGYPQTTPSSLFRIASCSKSLTGVRIHQLIQSGAITAQTLMQDELDLTTPLGGQPTDGRWDDVRVWHMLTHSGGWDRGVSIDPMFRDVKVNEAFGGTLPVSRLEIARYMANRSLDFTPGNSSKYSNFGFSLLGQIVEEETGIGYVQSVRNSVFAPLGVTRPKLGRTIQSLRASGEVRYHGRNLGISQSVVDSARPWVPNQYGGWNIENMDAHGGWILAAPDMAKMLSAFDLGASNPILDQTRTTEMFSTPMALQSMFPNTARGWFRANLGGGVTAMGHNGSLQGTSALAYRRSDGVSIVVLFNKDMKSSDVLWMTGHPLGNALNAAVNGVTSWPTTDKFPSVGIPSFD